MDIDSGYFATVRVLFHQYHVPIWQPDKMATAIFNADWNETTAQFNDPNLVVSPINSRNAFSALINSAHHTLLIEAEEMNDNDIEQALTNAAHQGVQVELKTPRAKATGVLSGASTLPVSPA